MFKMTQCFPKVRKDISYGGLDKHVGSSKRAGMARVETTRKGWTWSKESGGAAL